MVEPVVIPEDAVEAAAKAVFEQQYEPEEWELVVAQTQQRYLDEARLALEAAAPHMLAEAWDEGWDRFAGFDSRPGGPYPANPYRTAK